MARSRMPLDLDELGRLASLGLTQAQIYQAVGISEGTLRRRRIESARVNTAIGRARARGTDLISSTLAGNLRAQIFFLKTPGGWQRALPAPNAPAMTREQALDDLILTFD